MVKHEYNDPQTVTLNNSQIAVNSQGKGIGGNIDLQAEALTLKEQSAITAKTLSTDGGDIEITVGGNLVLRNTSQISASAGTAEAGGDGGNIDIDAQFIIAYPSEDSDITANAFFGNGGNISITTQGLFGIEFRERPTILSDITASSQKGLAGTVDINTPEIDPNRGLSKLPEEAVEVEVAEGCQAAEGQAAVAFFNIGRGGLPTIPTEPLESSDILEDLQPPAEWQENLTYAPNSSTVPNEIVEARGWKIDEQGNIVFVAEIDSARAQTDGCRLNNTRSSLEAR